MPEPTDILLVHDEDPVGDALVAELGAAGLTCCDVPPDAPRDELADRGFGCRAIISASARVPLGHLLRAAEMPGMRGVVLVERAARELGPLKRSGVPYTVLRPAPLLEELEATLAPALAAGRLMLEREREPRLSWVAARDVARCAIAALDADEACGRVLDVAAPEPLALGELAAQLAAARGQRLAVSRPPRWAQRAARAFGRTPFVLDGALVRTVDGSAAASLLRDGWSSVEAAVRSGKKSDELAVRSG